MNGLSLDIQAQFLKEINNVKACSLFITLLFSGPLSFHSLFSPGEVNPALAQQGL